ncbi:MAG TPA: hypothetical protein VK927_09175, partial [Adhaeribacter sp.]|nr:hypothetical protein [Adhaeribacter sp.]
MENFLPTRSHLRPSTSGRMRSAMLWLFLFAAWLGSATSTMAQSSTINTNFANNNGSGTTTFNLQNTNTYDIIITEIGGVTGATGSQTATLYYKTTPVNGAPGAIDPANGWTLAATGTFTGVANTTTSTAQPVITNMSFILPAGATYGMAVSSTSFRYSTLPGGTQTIPAGGVNLITGDNIGFGGGTPPAAPTFTPRGFIGYITFHPATPCVAPPTGGQAVSAVSSVCPNTPFELSLTGASGGMGMTYQWQSSANGTTGWTNIAGANNAIYTATQTATTFYRAQLTCSTQVATSAPVQVTTSAIPTSGTFTIDKGNPASATNFQSITAAIASIECGGVNGPTTFNVVAGSGPYNEQVVIPVIPGTSATNTVTINGNGNTISANPSGNLGVVTLDGADFVKIDNFVLTVDAAATSGWGVQFLNSADNNTI